MEAYNAETVLATLRTRALYVTAIDRENPVTAAIARTAHIGGVRPKAVLAFFRSFSTLLRAGVSMQRALTVAIERADDDVLREALQSALADVEHGSPLSEALARRPQAFPQLHIAMIRAGEAGGILDEVLERLASFLEREADLRKRVRAALAYPAVVLASAITLLIFLIVRIVPMFASMFESFHVDLPPATRFLLGLGSLLQQPPVWFLATASMIATATALQRFSRSTGGSLAIDRLRFHVPVVGALSQKAIIARLSRMLATLLRSGIDLVSAIEVVVPVAGSPLYAGALTKLGIALREGESLTQPLVETRLFDPMFLALVRVGEETGTVDDMLLRVAEYFESDVEATIATLSAVIEPTLIVALGGIVGFIVITMFVPLYSLIGSISK